MKILKPDWGGRLMTGKQQSRQMAVGGGAMGSGCVCLCHKTNKGLLFNVLIHVYSNKTFIQIKRELRGPNLFEQKKKKKVPGYAIWEGFRGTRGVRSSGTTGSFLYKNGLETNVCTHVDIIKLGSLRLAFQLSRVRGI